MVSTNLSLSLTLALTLTILFLAAADLDDENRLGTTAEPPPPNGGNWIVLQPSIGVSAMHMQLLHDNKVIIFDGTEVGPSNLTLPDNRCLTVTRHAILRRRIRRRISRRVRRPGANSTSSFATTVVSSVVSVPVSDCTAHSVLYDIATNTFRPLTLRTNTWCSSGSLLPDGTLLQTGGYGDDGIRKIRTFSSLDHNSDWTELASPALFQRRWYSSNQILPDGRVIIVGGRQSFSYEFFPKAAPRTANDQSFYMRFLAETLDPYEENNLYPFLHLLPDGNLFVFANNRSVAFDYTRNLVVKRFPPIPGGFKRSYPSTGSSVLLPIRLPAGDRPPAAEIMICGGAPAGAFSLANRARIFLPAARTCGRIRVSGDEEDPNWAMEEMPMPRVMPDMLILPTGDVIIVNGAARGTAGWNDAIEPVLSPVLYRPGANPGRRFTILNPTTVPRMYHSSAVLLPGGGILVGGSNPHRRYNFTGKPYPTELSLELYKPYYLGTEYANLRPSILTVEARMQSVSYGEIFAVTFVLKEYREREGISVAIVTPSFSTHSYAMNQRMLVLEVIGVQRLSDVAFKATTRGPPTSSVGPPGYYMLFVVHSGVPSEGVWIRVL